MREFMLTIYQPDGEVPPPEVLEPIMRNVHTLNDEIRSAGAWMLTAALQPATAATVVRHRDGGSVLTDGPFIESKEHVGGFWLIRVPDLEAALEWARKAARVTTLPIEVRPVQHSDL